MQVGVAPKKGIFEELPKVLSALPKVQAEPFNPFSYYDVTIGFFKQGCRNIEFNPETEMLEGHRLPATISYMDVEPLRLDRAVCKDDPKLIRRYESLFNHVGRLVVEDRYQEVRQLLHSSVPVEASRASSGVQVILSDGYEAKIELMRAIGKRQPFIVLESEASSEIIKVLRCPYPWMLPFKSIQEAIERYEMICMSQTLSKALDEARERCFSERLHSRFLHVWAKVLHG